MDSYFTDRVASAPGLADRRRRHDCSQSRVVKQMSPRVACFTNGRSGGGWTMDGARAEHRLIPAHNATFHSLNYYEILTCTTSTSFLHELHVTCTCTCISIDSSRALSRVSVRLVLIRSQAFSVLRPGPVTSIIQSVHRSRALPSIFVVHVASKTAANRGS